MRRLMLLLLLTTVALFAQVRSSPMRFTATANAVDGTTAKGTLAHKGVVAADPAVLPLGSRIRVSGAGAYSGVYIVTDTGARVAGRKIDIYVPSTAEAKRFGKKMVTVRVLTLGDNKKDGRESGPA